MKGRQSRFGGTPEMGIGSIGSTPSFYQQDQDYWNKAQAEDQATQAQSSLINVMAAAETNLGKGLASIANGEALTRTKSQLTSAIQAVLQGTSSSSTTTGSSATGSTAPSSGTSASPSLPTPATGIGTVPLTTTTPLSTLGILSGEAFSIDDGTNITKYTSTGTDTVASLINAINSGPAFVTASLNASGHLTITGRNTKEIVTVQGTGNVATVLGFGTSNDSFTPTIPKTSSASTASNPAGASTTSSTSSSAGTSSSTSTSSKSTSSSSSAAVSSIAEELSSSAASILSASGVSGTLVDMLA
jgi:hypothetical protein